MKKFPGQANNEKVLYFSRTNTLYYIINEFTKIFIGIGVIGFIVFISVFLDSLQIGLIIGLVLLAILIYIMYLFHEKTYVIITNKRILKHVRNGIFSEHMKELKLDQLNEVSSRKRGVLEKLLKIGNIKITGKDKENVIWFEGIKYPQEVVLYISRLRDFLVENPGFDYKEIIEFKTRKERKKK